MPRRRPLALSIIPALQPLSPPAPVGGHCACLGNTSTRPQKPRQTSGRAGGVLQPAAQVRPWCGGSDGNRPKKGLAAGVQRHRRHAALEAYLGSTCLPFCEGPLAAKAHWRPMWQLRRYSHPPALGPQRTVGTFVALEKLPGPPAPVAAKARWRLSLQLRRCSCPPALKSGGLVCYGRWQLSCLVEPAVVWCGAQL